MATEVKMPQLGLTMTEGVIASWKKKVGDTVKIGEVLAEIETDKISTEYESDVEGVVLALVAKEGDEVPVQGLIAIVGAAGEKFELPDTAASAPANSPATPAATVAASAVSATETAVSGNRVRISPLAKKIAQQNNIDIQTLAGTGPSGRIVQKDIYLAIEKGPATTAGAAATPSSVQDEGAQRERMTSMRKVVADRMLRAHSEIPAVTQTMKIDVTDLLKFRSDINAKRDTRFSINDLVLKAVAKALSKHKKQMLVSVDGTDIIYHDHVNLGMAVALEEGLIVPVIRDADKMSLEAISQSAKDLAERARSNTLSQEEYQGSTFSISNLGMFGIESFTPMINQPNAAILGVCSIEDELALRDGQVENRNILRISLSYDHRVLDGAVAAHFQQTLKKLLETPIDIIL